MIELLEIHTNFLCRIGRANSKGQSPIVLRVIFRDQRRDLYTGLYCNKEYWDTGNRKVSHGCEQAETINKNLELINYKTIQLFDKLRFGGLPFTIDELVDKLKGKEEKPGLLIDYLIMRNDELKRKVEIDITASTFEKYERIKRFIIDFLENEFKIKNYPLIRIDGVFLERYFQYLRMVRKINNNTAVKYMACLKTLLMPAIQNGMIKNDPYKDMKFRLKVIHKEFLADEEIDLLVKTEFNSPDLTRIRDQFLFCCYTGLAYSDLRQLNRNHFVKQREDYYILKPRQKTGQQSIIPLLPVAERILMKYSSTNDFRDFKWYISANQKMNQRLKTIGDSSGQIKILHMHLARHTFATTITLSNGVPIESVSSMLGHASLRQTQHYAKIVATKVIKDMAIVKEVYK